MSQFSFTMGVLLTFLTFSSLFCTQSAIAYTAGERGIMSLGNNSASIDYLGNIDSTVHGERIPRFDFFGEIF